jgi:FixJ family two-component response regulator
LSLTARLKAVRPDLVVIMCTGFSEVANEETALAAGATAFFNKPVSADELATALTAALPKQPVS